MYLMIAVVKDSGTDGVVCIGGSPLPRLGFRLLASPAVVGPTSLGVTPSLPQWFH